MGNNKAKSHKNLTYNTSQKPITCSICGRSINVFEPMHMVSDIKGFICDECYEKWYEENYGRGN